MRVDIATLNSMLRYDAETGVLYWKERSPDMFKNPKSAAAWNAKYANKPAINGIHNGYRYGSLFGRATEAHRIAWALHHGKWPEHHIDHINGDRSDNRIVNLRDVPHRINLRNTKLSNHNTSGVMGVQWKNYAQKWVVNVGGEYIGIFASFEDAVAARKAAEKKRGYHQNHGRTKVAKQTLENSSRKPAQ
jgi:HNH endonuclease